MKFLQTLFAAQKKMSSSDLHLYVGFPPYLRGSDGALYPVKDYEKLTQDDTLHIAKTLLSERQLQDLHENWDFEFSAHLEEISRFRVNFFYDHRGISIVFRMINDDVLSIDKLGLPPVVKDLAKEEAGLILITGPNGTGKSTTMSSIINEINNTRNCNIISIEDPIEYLHKSNKSVISQREVGTHVKSFSHTAKYLFRQDVDVVIVGEMRDTESFSLALDIAETGHVVIATVHAQDCAAVVSRIVGSFAADKQNLIRMKLANALKAVVSQRLIPLKDYSGRVAAVETLIVNGAVKSAIKESEDHRLYNLMETGRSDGMQTFDDALFELFLEGKISKEQAILSSDNRDNLISLIERSGESVFDD